MPPGVPIPEFAVAGDLSGFGVVPCVLWSGRSFLEARVANGLSVFVPV